MNEGVWSAGGMIQAREKPKYWRKSCPDFTLFATYLT